MAEPLQRRSFRDRFRSAVQRFGDAFSVRFGISVFPGDESSVQKRLRQTVQEPFLDQISRLSDRIKERTAIRHVEPELFSEHGRGEISFARERYEEMYQDALDEFLSNDRRREEFKAAVEEAHRRSRFSIVESKLAEFDRAHIDPVNLFYLHRATSKFLSARKTLDFLENRLAGFADPRKLGRFLTRNWEAGHHLAAFHRIYDVAHAFDNFKAEVSNYESEFPRINKETMIPGVKHHLAVGNKAAFLSQYPSVFGGDNFNLAELEPAPSYSGSRRIFLISSVDVEGHADDYRTKVNNVRNLLMGMDLKTARYVKSDQLFDDSAKEQFLREHAHDVHQEFVRRGVKGAGLFALYDTHTRKLCYVAAGHGHPVVFDPSVGRLPPSQEAGDIMLGVDLSKFTGIPHSPEDYTMHSIHLTPGRALHIRTDGPDELKSLLHNGGTQMIHEDLDDEFLNHLRNRASAKQAAEGVLNYAYKTRGAQFLADDARSFVMVAQTRRARGRRASI
ncbi:SpoIIE family protein phosphatase [Candidatus Micrarchaeota archaeon]|nr:SpoIIE family protein phosphatase [Candidatus Micrarchaeota archaeon]